MLCVNGFHIIQKGKRMVFNTLIHYILENTFFVYMIYMHYYVNYVSNRAIIYYIILFFFIYFYFLCDFIFYGLIY